MAEYEPPTTAYDHSEEDRREHIDRIKEIVAQDLHSAAAIIGYEARSADQKLGEVIDLVFDDSAWNVKQWEHGELWQFEPMTIHDFSFGPAFGKEDRARPGYGKW